MKKTIRVEIVSAESHIFSGAAVMVIAAGVEGDLGITPGHAALLTTLQPGPVRILYEDKAEELIYVSGGILEVQPDVVTVLADTVVRAHDFNEAEVLKAKAQAEALLATQQTDFDYTMARAELARAAGMLRAIRSMKRELKG